MEKVVVIFGANTGYTTTAGATELQTIEQEELTWRVLGASGDNVLLISSTPTNNELCFCGYVGYNNYEDILNTACSTLYSKEGVGTARSITMDDIDTYLDGSNFDKALFENGESSGYYGYTNTDITSKFNYDKTTNTLTKLEGGTTTLSLTSNAYYYTASDYITNPTKLDLLQGSNNYSYWIASRSIRVYSEDIEWLFSVVAEGFLGSGTGFSDEDPIRSLVTWLSFRPVVCLKADVSNAIVPKFDPHS